LEQGQLGEHKNHISSPCELISTSEVEIAIAKYELDKSAGPSGVVVEILKASGEEGRVGNE